MRSIFVKLSGPAALAAVGGGAASALLSIVTVQKTSLALVLGCLSPLPIMLATLSFGSHAGLIAALVGAVVLGAFEVVKNGALQQPGQLATIGVDILVYAVSVAVSGWWLALIGASTRLIAPTVPQADNRKLGLIMASTAVFASLGVALDFLGTVVTHGGFQATIDAMAGLVEPFVRAEFGARQLPKGIDLHEFAVAATWAQMPILSASTFISLCFNIWLAGQITLASGRLAAAWPDVPRSLKLPRSMVALFAVALGLSFAGGPIAMLALIVIGALAMALTFQGLAVVHNATRGKSYRLPLLIIVYLSLPWLMIFYTLLGLMDAGLSFRDRLTPAASGTL